MMGRRGWAFLEYKQGEKINSHLSKNDKQSFTDNKYLSVMKIFLD